MVKGISEKEATVRLKEFGRNIIKDRHKSTLLNKLIEQFKSFLIVLLLFAAVFSFLLGDILDGSLILAIILLNAFFGLFQEYKAEEAVSALKEITVSTIRVIRDGIEQELDSTYLVPGDIIFVEEGVKLPADARLIESVNLEINEAALTGESIPLVKIEGDEVFMGTIVARGRGLAEVTHTGMATKFGHIADKLMDVKEDLTPLQKKLTQLTEIIGLVGIILSIVVFGLSTLQGAGYFPSFLLAVSLAVAVVPESLPAVMTVILSIGVKRMADRKAIVRRLASIEALGGTTLIATDKTGTLTENRMNVKELYLNNKLISAGDLKHEKKKNNYLHLLILNGILCSTASLVNVHDHGEQFEVLGDPTEGALLLLAKQVGYDIESVREEWQIRDESPFDSVTKRMSVLVQNHHENIIFTKGAPESMLDICTSILENGKKMKLTDKRKDEIHEKVTEWAHQGLRVLACSYEETSRNGSISSRKQIFLGLIAIHDPPRKEAQLAVKKAQEAGIKVIMITGDNEKTAEAIGSAVGLLNEGDIIVKGEQLDTYSDVALMKLLPHVRIFARTTPFHKSRIVSLYQQLGEIVTVTGDGVNDAIALKQADVGVAMGRVGTDVARETADIIITDDNFATIISAIEEGRNILKRLKNSVKYLLTGNLSEAVTLLLGLALGFPPIFLPIQLLYINLISDGIPALALGFTPRNEHVMTSKPNKKLHLLSQADYHYIVVIGLVIAGMVFSVFYLHNGIEIEKRTAAFATMAMIQIFLFVDVWFSHLSKSQKIRSAFTPIFLFTTLFPLLLQLAIVRFPFIAELFKTSTVSFENFGIYFSVALSALLSIGVLRLTYRNINK